MGIPFMPAGMTCDRASLPGSYIPGGGQSLMTTEALSSKGLVRSARE